MYYIHENRSIKGSNQKNTEKDYIKNGLNFRDLWNKAYKHICNENPKRREKKMAGTIFE